MNKQVLIDNNLSHKLKELENQLPINVRHVSDDRLGKSFDKEIWDYANNNDMIILTKDSDFKNLSDLYDCPPKVIHLKCGNKTTKYISKLILSKREVIQNFILNNLECYLEIN